MTTDKTNNHTCTSDCGHQKDCPLCPHGVHEELECEVCDAPIATHTTPQREIKFRAWDRENKRMGEVSTLQFHRPWATKDEDGDWIDVFEPTIEVLFGTIEKAFTEDEVELMQFTGLKDKNGEEVYEGDVVKWSDGEYKHPSNPRIAEVRFDPELSFFVHNVDGGHKFGYSNFAYKNTEKYLEIIGNVYENPELLTPNKE